MRRTLLLLLLCWFSQANAAPLELSTLGQSATKGKYDPADTARPGVCIEIIQALMHVDPDLKISGQNQLKPLPEVEAALTEGRIDLFVGLIRTPEREAKFDFLEPKVFSFQHKIAVKAADKGLKIASFDDLRKLDGTIATTQGTAYVAFLEKQGGLKIDAGSKDPASILKKLTLGVNNVRFYYQADLNLIDYIAEANLKDLVVILPHSFKDDAQYLAVSKQLAAPARKRLVAALEKLDKSGELKRIYARYVPD
ncbi:hypothetical protein GCM10025771_07830 [Niveibacterium umoris]|uniref:Glutamate/aspartate transport system substrate-binding protein n=1 Tax=Niveibacterium umoris TaxID=1193620 RepID=A0A840BL01_9RHOO|nr:transporter substrate-binding domain-containing protein [Niveibacterium umoris]MBB4013670.1 glutamate/aspartate transport system substrate-binding protein [Niveibacterium umoris]